MVVKVEANGRKQLMMYSRGVHGNVNTMGMGIAFRLLMEMGVGMGITSREQNWHICKRSPALNSNM